MKNCKTLFCFVSLFAFTLCSCGNNGVHHQEKDYMIDMDYVDDFKILQLTDLHLGQKDDLDLHFDFIDLTIKDANPNFIVITGDVFTFANRRVMKTVFDFFDSYQIPWGVTWGNHDEQCDFSINYMTGELNKRREKDTYCKFIDIQKDDVFGYANYVINLKQGNDIKYQLYMLDSNRYYYGSYMGYDYIHEDQIKWYEDMVNYSKTLNNNAIVPSIAFFHIPVPEFKVAYDLYEKDPTNADIQYFYGERRETECPPDINTGFFDKVVELGSTKGIFVGHDHVNNYDIAYKGVRLVYGVKSTDRIYYDPDVIGGLTITIKNDSSFECNRIYHSYAGLK